MNVERRVELMPLSQIRRALRNPKQHADADIIASLRRFGLAELILIDERTGLLVAGEGRVNALDALRREDVANPPAGVSLDGREWMIPVQRGWASKDDREADAYLIASNQLSIKGGWDDKGLADLLAELGRELDGIGFSDNDLDALFAAAVQPSTEQILDRMAQGDPTAGLDALDAPPAKPKPPITDPFGRDDNGEDRDRGRPAGQRPPEQGPPWGSPAPAHTPAIPGGSTPGVQGGTEPQWFQLTYSVTHEQRQVVNEAIRAAQAAAAADSERGLSAAAALAKVCRTYLDTIKPADAEPAAEPAAEQPDGEPADVPG